MARYLLTPDAVGDLEEIWWFIAKDNPEAADRVEREILATCELLVERPLLGRARTDLTNRPVRFWTVPRFPSYMIVYRPDLKPLRVIRVLHGMRDLRRVLEP
jgi:plasmid stabilization system protein ParE